MRPKTRCPSQTPSPSFRSAFGVPQALVFYIAYKGKKRSPGKRIPTEKLDMNNLFVLQYISVAQGGALERTRQTDNH